MDNENERRVFIEKVLKVLMCRFYGQSTRNFPNFFMNAKSGAWMLKDFDNRGEEHRPRGRCEMCSETCAG